VLKVGCVNQGVFSWRESKLLPEELTPLPELALAADDILVSRANTRELVGSAAIVDRDYPRLMLCDKLYRLRLHRDRCLPAFLVRFLETRFARTQIEALATGASASMVNISQSTILELPIALPPLSEQVEIARAIESTTTELDLLSAASRQTLDLLQERRSALINAAVTGQTSIRGLVPADAALTAETTAAGAP
jgi:type I restriction enzyme S subunit